MTLGNDIIEKIRTLLTAKDDDFACQGVLLMETFCKTPEEVRSILRSINPEYYEKEGCLSVLRTSQTLLEIIGLLAELGDDEILGLTQIRMSYCTIHSIPTGFNKLVKLKRLVLRSNHITRIDTLPPNLEELDVYNNDITIVSPLLQLQNIKDLCLTENPITQLPLSLFEGGLEKLELQTGKLNADWLSSLEARTKTFVDTVMAEDSSKIESIDRFLRRFPNHQDFIVSAISEWHPGFKKILIEHSLSTPKSLPTWLKHVNHIEEIKLGHVNETGFPDWFFNFTMLKKIEIEKSGFNKLGDGLKNMQSLKHLSIVDCNLDGFPEEIQSIPQLETLTVSQTDLKEIPEWIGTLKDLKQLDLSHNQIEVLPTTLGNIRGLEELILHDNHIAVLPSTLGELINLNRLIMSENPLERLPESFSNLTLLKTERKKYVPISRWSNSRVIPPHTFPDSLWANQALILESLSFSNVSIYDCPYKALFLLDTEAKPFIDSLIGKDTANITNRSSLKKKLDSEMLFWAIISIAKWNPVFRDSIQNLTYSGSQLISIPSDIKILTNLKTLTLKYTYIESLPDEIGDLRNLTHIYLNGTNIHSLPQGIQKMSSLKYLNLYRSNAPESSREKFQALLPDCRIAM